MDHNGLLRLLRAATLECNKVVACRSGKEAVNWEWAVTPIMYPESRCPYCHDPIRSPGIWFLKGPNHSRLAGAIFPQPNGKVVVVNPSHPHDICGGQLCLGSHATGIAVFMAEANLRDTPMGSHYIPRWLKRYWRHDCKEMRWFLYAAHYRDQLAELDNLTGVIP